VFFRRKGQSTRATAHIENVETRSQVGLCPLAVKPREREVASAGGLQKETHQLEGVPCHEKDNYQVDEVGQIVDH